MYGLQKTLQMGMMEEARYCSAIQFKEEKQKKRENISSYFGIVTVEKFDDISMNAWILVKGCQNRHTRNFNEFF